MTHPCHLCGAHSVVQCSRCPRCMCEKHAVVVGNETLCQKCSRRDKAEYSEAEG